MFLCNEKSFAIALIIFFAFASNAKSFSIAVSCVCVLKLLFLRLRVTQKALQLSFISFGFFAPFKLCFWTDWQKLFVNFSFLLSKVRLRNMECGVTSIHVL